MNASYAQLLKYGLVGGVNTLLTLAVFWLLRQVGTGLDLSNLLSYVAGMTCSFMLNKFWTFRALGHRWWRESALFLLGAGLCWAVQWGAFRALLTFLPELWAQVGGMVVYTLLNFVYNKIVTFKA